LETAALRGAALETTMMQSITPALPSYLVERPIHIPALERTLAGSLGMVTAPRAVVMVLSDTGACRHRRYELELARAWRSEGLATLMVDLLSPDEQGQEETAAALRLDAMELAHRIAFARAWLGAMPLLDRLPVGLMGAGGAGAAALIELAGRPLHYSAAVLRDAQPMRAGLALEQCAMPVLLVVDQEDEALVKLNRDALARMHGDVALVTLSSEPCEDSRDGERREMSTHIAAWLVKHLLPASPPAPRDALRPISTCRPSSDLDH
jgi:dienelactone hydrolase